MAPLDFRGVLVLESGQKIRGVVASVRGKEPLPGSDPLQQQTRCISITTRITVGR